MIGQQLDRLARTMLARVGYQPHRLFYGVGHARHHHVAQSEGYLSRFKLLNKVQRVLLGLASDPLVQAGINGLNADQHVVSLREHRVPAVMSSLA